MKVKELIAILEKCNPELNVLMEDQRPNNPTNVIPVSMVLVEEGEFDDSIIFVRDEDEYDNDEEVFDEDYGAYDLSEADLPLDTM